MTTEDAAHTVATAVVSIATKTLLNKHHQQQHATTPRNNNNNSLSLMMGNDDERDVDAKGDDDSVSSPPAKKFDATRGFYHQHLLQQQQLKPASDGVLKEKNGDTEFVVKNYASSVEEVANASPPSHSLHYHQHFASQQQPSRNNADVDHDDPVVVDSHSPQQQQQNVGAKSTSPSTTTPSQAQRSPPGFAAAAAANHPLALLERKFMGENGGGGARRSSNGGGDMQQASAATNNVGKSLKKPSIAVAVTGNGGHQLQQQRHPLLVDELHHHSYGVPATGTGAADAHTNHYRNSVIFGNGSMHNRETPVNSNGNRRLNGVSFTTQALQEAAGTAPSHAPPHKTSIGMKRPASEAARKSPAAKTSAFALMPSGGAGGVPLVATTTAATPTLLSSAAAASNQQHAAAAAAAFAAAHPAMFSHAPPPGEIMAAMAAAATTSGFPMLLPGGPLFPQSLQLPPHLHHLPPPQQQFFLSAGLQPPPSAPGGGSGCFAALQPAMSGTSTSSHQQQQNVFANAFLPFNAFIPPAGFFGMGPTNNNVAQQQQQPVGITDLFAAQQQLAAAAQLAQQQQQQNNPATAAAMMSSMLQHPFLSLMSGAGEGFPVGSGEMLALFQQQQHQQQSQQQSFNSNTSSTNNNKQRLQPNTNSSFNAATKRSQQQQQQQSSYDASLFNVLMAAASGQSRLPCTYRTCDGKECGKMFSSGEEIVEHYKSSHLNQQQVTSPTVTSTTNNHLGCLFGTGSKASSNNGVKGGLIETPVLKAPTVGVDFGSTTTITARNLQTNTQFDASAATLSSTSTRVSSEGPLPATNFVLPKLNNQNSHQQQPLQQQRSPKQQHKISPTSVAASVFLSNARRQSSSLGNSPPTTSGSDAARQAAINNNFCPTFDFPFTNPTTSSVGVNRFFPCASSANASSASSNATAFLSASLANETSNTFQHNANHQQKFSVPSIVGAVNSLSTSSASIQQQQQPFATVEQMQQLQVLAALASAITAQHEQQQQIAFATANASNFMLPIGVGGEARRQTTLFPAAVSAGFSSPSSVSFGHSLNLIGAATRPTPLPQNFNIAALYGTNDGGDANTGNMLQQKLATEKQQNLQKQNSIASHQQLQNGNVNGKTSNNIRRQHQSSPVATMGITQIDALTAMTNTIDTSGNVTAHHNSNKR